MSSPIAKQKKNVIKDGLVRVHQDLSHTHRVDILARKIAGEIESQFPGVRKIECLDVGCGDMKISENIHRHNPKTVWNCIDIHRLPDELREDPRWKKYKEFDGVHLPFHDRSMDVVMFCDVLHHAGENIPALLRESARVGKTISIPEPC
jgi:ubiquinone/menaquinone biosynthesis C-methylase UbiE